MKRQLSVLAVAGLSLVGCASSQRLEVVPKPSQATVARFEAMKKLNGRWEAVTPMEGMSPVCEFKVIAGGSTIVETMFPGSTHEMINTYTINGDSIVATHYCALGNQPHMKLLAGSDTDFLFASTGVSNLHSKTQDYMMDVHITLAGPDRYTAKWRGQTGGKVGEHAVFEMKRVK